MKVLNNKMRKLEAKPDFNRRLALETMNTHSKLMHEQLSGIMTSFQTAIEVAPVFAATVRRLDEDEDDDDDEDDIKIMVSKK